VNWLTYASQAARFLEGLENLSVPAAAIGGWRLCDRSLTAPAHLTPARPEFPPVLDPRSGDGLPLHVGDRVRAATGERLYVVLPIAGARTARSPGGRARMLPLELPRYPSGSVLSR